MDRVHHLQVFVRVAACENFSQAANQLNMSRAAVSNAVQQLEIWLGTKLLHRSTRQVTLTRDGEELLHRAISLVADMDELQQQFHPNLNGAKGKIRVDMPTRIARRIVAPSLPDFFATHPGIEIELGSSDRTTDLTQDGIDCALRVGALSNTNVVAKSLGTFEIINCASPEYLTAHGEPKTPYELDNHLCVNYISLPGGKITPWEWVEKGIVHTRSIHSATSANNVEIYIACALAGLGMIQVPRFDVVDHLESSELVELMSQAKPPPLPVHLVYPSRHQLTKRIKLFTDWLAKILSPYLESQITSTAHVSPDQSAPE